MVLNIPVVDTASTYYLAMDTSKNFYDSAFISTEKTEIVEMLLHAYIFLHLAGFPSHSALD